MSDHAQNSIVPTDAQHDAHFARICVDCETPFSNIIPKAGDCKEGDICQDCWDARQIELETNDHD